MARTRLLHLFAQPLSRTLEIADAVRSGRDRSARPPSPASAMEELRGMVTAIQKRATTELKRDPAEVREAAYAVVAFLDDIFPTLRGWYDNREPLQREMYDERKAGSGFFRRTETFSESQAELRELYLTVMGIGFRGEYRDDPDRPWSPDELTRMARRAQEQAERLALRLKPEPLPPAAFEQADGDKGRLTPQPYQVSRELAPVIPRETDWKPLLAAAAVLLLVCAGSLAYLLWPAARVDGVALARDAVRELACSRIEATPGADGAVALNGRYADAAALDAAIGALKAKGVERIERGGLTLVPAPFCRMLDLVERHTQTGPLAASAPGGLEGLPVRSDGPQLRPNRADARYPVGDVLYIDVAVPAGTGGHLTVLYVHPQTIVAMLPSDQQPDDRVGSSGQSLRVGRPETELTERVLGWRIADPGGPGLLVALVTPAPLLNPRMPAGSIDEALRQLEEGLLRQPALPGQPPSVRALANLRAITVLPRRVGMGMPAPDEARP